MSTAAGAIVAPVARSPFEHFLLVNLPIDTRAPQVVEHLSAPGTTPLTETVLSFCFPDALHEQPSPTGEEYTFALTASDGARQYGFCCTLPAQRSSPVITCVCLLSYHMWAGYFHQIHLWLRECLASRPPCHHVLLEHLLRSGCPRPGQAPSMPPAAGLSGLRSPLQPPRNNSIPPPVRPRSGAPALHDRAVACLFRALDTERLLYLFTALLCERRIVFTSKHLTHLSQCVHAAEALLWPFRWQQVFVPILPDTMMSYCAAPMPFLVGLPSALLPQLEALPLERLIVVSLDHNRTGAFQEDVDLVPARLLNKLKQRLDQCAGAAAAGSVALCFREFFLALFLRYRGFFAPTAGGFRFEQAAFIAQQSKDTRPFLEAFCGSQMFERWIAEREHDLEQGRPTHDHFHRELDTYVDDSASYQSYSVKLQNATNKLLGSVMSKYKRAKEKYVGGPESTPATPAGRNVSTTASSSAGGATLQRHGSSPAVTANRQRQQLASVATLRNATSVSSGLQRGASPRPPPPSGSHRRRLPTSLATAKTPEQLYQQRREEYRARRRSQQPVPRRVFPAAERVTCNRPDAVMQMAVDDPLERISFGRLHCSLAPGRAPADNVLFEGDAPSDLARRRLLTSDEADRVQRQRCLAAQLGRGGGYPPAARDSGPGSSGVPRSSPFAHVTTPVSCPQLPTRAAPPLPGPQVVLQRPQLVHVPVPTTEDVVADPPVELVSFSELSVVASPNPAAASPSSAFSSAPSYSGSSFASSSSSSSSSSLSSSSLSSSSSPILVPRATTVSSGGFLFTPPDVAPSSFLSPPNQSPGVFVGQSSGVLLPFAPSQQGDPVRGNTFDLL